MSTSTYRIYAAFFTTAPELGFFVGFSKNHTKGKILIAIKNNATGRQNKMGKALALHPADLTAQIIETIYCTQKEVRKRVADIITFYKTVENGLNEPAKVKNLKVCPFCASTFKYKCSLNKHKKDKHGYVPKTQPVPVTEKISQPIQQPIQQIAVQ